MKFALKQFGVILITAICAIAVAAVHACFVWPEMKARTQGMDRQIAELVRMPMIFESCLLFFVTAYRVAQLLAHRIGDVRSAILLKAQATAHMRLLHATGGTLIIACRYFLRTYYGAPVWQNVLMILFGFALLITAIYRSPIRRPQITVDLETKSED